ncbi:hypothetical protein K6N86_001630, partial [Providencia rettgeri]|nr:hypothetical protein [Providencia rettgeri]
MKKILFALSICVTCGTTTQSVALPVAPVLPKPGSEYAGFQDYKGSNVYVPYDLPYIIKAEGGYNPRNIDDIAKQLLTLGQANYFNLQDYQKHVDQELAKRDSSIKDNTNDITALRQASSANALATKAAQDKANANAVDINRISTTMTMAVASNTTDIAGLKQSTGANAATAKDALNTANTNAVDIGRNTAKIFIHTTDIADLKQSVGANAA